jgi:hypothetical protein
MLSYNHFYVSTFTFHFKILFKKFSQQRAKYNLVIQMIRRTDFLPEENIVQNVETLHIT